MLAARWNLNGSRERTSNSRRHRVYPLLSTANPFFRLKGARQIGVVVGVTDGLYAEVNCFMAIGTPHLISKRGLRLLRRRTCAELWEMGVVCLEH